MSKNVWWILQRASTIGSLRIVARVATPGYVASSHSREVNKSASVANAFITNSQ